MGTWTSDELEKIADTEEIEIAALRPDGSLRKPVIIWVVRHGDDLYVRSVRGPTAGWFRVTQVRHEGRIWADGLAKDVTFVDADHTLDDEIDAVFRAKYRAYATTHVPPIVAPLARSTTLRLVPHPGDGQR